MAESTVREQLASSRSRIVSFAVIAAVLCGCSDPRGPKAYPAKGVVLVNGQPAGGAEITLYHTSDFGTDKTILPTAMSANDGSFTLSTYDANDGAPAGDYQVRVTWPAYHGRVPGPDRLQEKFSNPFKSGLTVHVDAKATQIPALEINYPEVLPATERPHGRPAAREDRKLKKSS
jgi:hypothetical protein